MLNKTSHRPVVKHFKDFHGMDRHICNYLETIQYGFRKGKKSLRPLLGHGRNFKKIIGHREEYSAFLTTSSKAFDCLEHDFVIGNALDFFVEF